MAITVTDVARGINGEGTRGLTWRVVDVLLDSSYPTGGEALTAANFGLSTIVMAIPSAPAGYVAEYDTANSKLKMYVRGVLTTNVAGSYTQNATIAAAALAEVADTTSLATVTVRLFVLGTVA